MGIFRNILNISRRSDPLNDPGVPFSSPAAWQLFSGSYQTESGEVIDNTNALQIVTVYACVRIIAESVATLPLLMKERLATGGHRDATDQNLYYLLSTEPNPEMSATTFFETLTGCLAFTGNGYAQIERNRFGQPVALWPLHPFKTTPKRDPQTNKIIYETTDGMLTGQSRILDAEDVLHVPLFCFDGLKGISPIDACRRTLGLSVAQEKSGARFFGNNSRPGGLLMNKGAKMDARALQEIKKSWEDQQGAINQGRVAVIPNGDWSYQALSISNEASQWLQSRGFSQAQIAQSVFRVPPHMVGDQAKLSGSNSEQLSIQFVQFCLQPYLRKIESEIARKLMPTMGPKANKFFVRFDENQLIRLDFKTQMEGYQAGIVGGWYSANDIRRKLGENPGGPELDIYRMAVNYTNALNMVTDGTEQEAPLPDDDSDGGGPVDSNDSVADAPVDGTDPNTPPVEPVSSNTQGDRNVLHAYTQAYYPLFRDAFQRIMKRSKRDSDAFNSTFRPVLECISAMALGFRDGVNDGQDPAVTDKIVGDVLKGIAKRADKWPAQQSGQEAQSLITNEFQKAVRTIHIEISKTLAAKDAVRQLNTSEDQNDEEDRTQNNSL